MKILLKFKATDVLNLCFPPAFSKKWCQLALVSVQSVSDKKKKKMIYDIILNPKSVNIRLLKNDN